MKRLFIASVLLLPTLAVAFELETVEPTQQYEPIILTPAQLHEQAFLGTLTGDPETFEFVLETPEEFSLQVTQRNHDPVPFLLIVVEKLKDGKGVAEVARGSAELTSWTAVRDAKLGMQTLTSEPLTVSVTPGVYRVEISTPENIGPYLLSFADTYTEGNYLKTLTGIWRAQRHFGLSWYRYLSSSYVSLPLGLGLVLVGWYLVRRDKRMRHDS